MKWPAGFMWGTGASSSQSEGAAPASNIIENERAGLMPASGTGIDFGTRYAEDFALYRSLGLTHHRLSIEWARIEPAEGEHDPQALGHYRDILQAALDTGITPWVTLHHFTLPKWFADKGGFSVEANRTYWLRHAEFMAEAFGDLVGGWKPVNETNYYGMISGSPAMGSGYDRPTQIVVDQQINLATCEAAMILRQTGKPVASIYGLAGLFAADDKPESAALCQQYIKENFDAGLGLHRDGVFVDKNDTVIERPDLKGCFDLIGFSFYGSFGFRDGAIVWRYPEDKPQSPLGYAIWADGLDDVLNRLHAMNLGVPLLVAEYGIGTDDDAQRAEYLTRGLEITHAAMERGIDIAGFIHWTGVDNYEWAHGYDVKFGIIDRDRNPKPSAQVLAAEALS